ncbi:MAG: response regulator transcription factor [Sphingobacteriales bacterium]|nr:MAG: response regulator transcription factor [Sphingobacteriales bacterium]
MSAPAKPLTCLIVDDEPLAQDVLATHIAQVPYLQLAGRCSNAMEAFEALHRQPIDLLFLDINMPVVSGLSFLRALKDPPAVILTTAYTEYALEGYELDVVDYLLKPVSFERFLKAVTKAAAQAGLSDKSVSSPPEAPIAPGLAANSPATAKSYFFIKSNGKLVKINHTDIRYVEGMKDYLKIHLTDKNIICHHTMKAMEEQLPDSQFIRVHKSYIVALNAVAAIAGTVITLNGGQEDIPLGSSYRDAVLAALAG